MIRSRPIPLSDAWKACAVPWKLRVTVGGSRSVAALSMRVSASPSDTPGRRLNETVAAGSCPRWFTDSGPTAGRIRATASSGTIRPPADLTYRLDRSFGSRCSRGSSSITT